MSHTFRTLAQAVLLIPLVGGCVQATSYRSAGESPPPAAVAPVAAPVVASVAASMVPLPGHPPIAVSGVVATFDSATDMLRFDDGRLVKLTGQSKLVAPVGDTVRPGDLVVLQNVLPVAVQSGFTTLAVGKPQRMGTIASVDEASGLLQLTDGTTVTVTNSTNVHVGAAGSNATLGQLVPGDQVVVIFGAPAPPPAADSVSAAPSALPRQDASPPAAEAAEVMIFRAARRP